MFGIPTEELGLILIICAVIFVASLPGIIGAVIAGKKGRSKFWWFILCWLCPFLIIAVAVLPPLAEIEGEYRKCPSCSKIIRWESINCKYCQKEI